MGVSTGQSVVKLFTIATTDGPTDFDAPPTGTLFVNGVANGAAVTITHVTGGTPSAGRYKFGITLPTLALYDLCEIVVTGTIGGIVTDRSVWEGTKEAASGGGGPFGPGVDSITLNLTNTTTSLAIANASVWVTSDVGGTDIVAGTVSTDVSGNVTFMLTAGDAYYYWAYKVGINAVQGVQFTASLSGNSFTTTSASGGTGVAWYYADEADVQDAVSAAGLTIMSNMENADENTNDARLARVGAYADAIMNGRFEPMGFTVPLSLDNVSDAQILKQISISIVIVQLCRWRMLQVIDGADVTRTTMEKFTDNWINNVEMLYDQINNGAIRLHSTRSLYGPQSNATARDSTGAYVYPQSPPGGIWSLGTGWSGGNW